MFASLQLLPVSLDVHVVRQCFGVTSYLVLVTEQVLVSLCYSLSYYVVGTWSLCSSRLRWAPRTTCESGNLTLHAALWVQLAEAWGRKGGYLPYEKVVKQAGSKDPD